jgi:hypothetical protein
LVVVLVVDTIPALALFDDAASPRRNPAAFTILSAPLVPKLLFIELDFSGEGFLSSWLELSLSAVP